MSLNKKDNAQAPKVTPAWISESFIVEPVILSTRLRLARNLDRYPFPHLAADSTLLEIANTIQQAIHHRPTKPLKTLQSVNISTLNDNQKAALVDSHLVSFMHVVAGPHRVALFDESRTVSIMVNEEDHIRIQAILPGLMPESAWSEADRLDDALTQRLPIAFHQAYGYLTSSLANTGTGMRVSVMAHLPGLAFLDKLGVTWQAARALGTTIRGIYGEAGEEHGDVYQLSNSTSIGLGERQIIGRIKAVATFLQTEEEWARHTIRTVRMDDVRILVDETLAKLKSASALTATEAMSMLSTLRMAEMLGIKTYVSHRMFCEMLISMRGSIGLIANKKNRARDVFYEDTRRPASLRNRLRQERAISNAIAKS